MRSLYAFGPYSNVQMSDLSRRRFVAGTGSILAVGALAGCTGNGDDEPANGDDAENGNGDAAPDDVDEYLSANDASLYDGTIVDMTGEEEITVMNGAGSDGLAYDPPAVRVDVGTTVVWEWTGEGGAHNVISDDPSDFELESDDGELIDEEGHTWEFTFDDAGTALYFCQAHSAQGQYGAVVVE